MNIKNFVSQRVFTGLNRVDELGGDFRDYLLEREDTPVLRKLGVRLAKLGGVNLEETRLGSVYEQELAIAAAAAPPPTAAEVASTERAGPGDSEIAAQIYGKESCPWTGRARTLLNDAKVDFDFVELDDSENTHWEGKLVSMTEQTSVPYVFLRGEFVGGFNELSEVIRLGQLENRTTPFANRAEINAARPHSVIQIAARESAA